jgi:hypothetical protein
MLKDGPFRARHDHPKADVPDVGDEPKADVLTSL